MIVIVIDAVIKKTEYNLTSHNLDVPFKILLLEDQLAWDELLSAKLFSYSRKNILKGVVDYSTHKIELRNNWDPVKCIWFTTNPINIVKMFYNSLSYA